MALRYILQDEEGDVGSVTLTLGSWGETVDESIVPLMLDACKQGSVVAHGRTIETPCEAECELVETD